MEPIEIKELAEDYLPYIYLLIGVFVGLVIGVILYFVLNLKSPLMQSINDDFAKDRPVTVFEEDWNPEDRWEKRELGKGVARIYKNGMVDVEMNSGHGVNVPFRLIRFDDVGHISQK